jgi:hypothetical protein
LAASRKIGLLQIAKLIENNSIPISAFPWSFSPGKVAKLIARLLFSFSLHVTQSASRRVQSFFFPPLCKFIHEKQETTSGIYGSRTPT